MIAISAWVCGLVFGLGLMLSGITDPARVLGFLDVAGRWDPTLGVVMAAALVVATPAFAIARRRRHALLGPSMALPAATPIDARLLAGAGLLGIGWGLAGLGPGAAIVLLPTGRIAVWVFVFAMVAGMAAFEAVQRRSSRAG